MEPQTKGKADPELRGRLEEAASQHDYICMFISHSKGKAEGHGSKRSNEFEDKRLQKVSTEDTLQNKPASPQSKWETLSDINTQTISNRGWDEPWTLSSDQNTLRNAKNMFGQPSQSLHVDHFTLEGKNKRVKNVLNCNITCNKLL